MRLALSVTIALAGSLGLAPVALAQSGNGLYEPFPDGIRKDRAVLFVERLGLGEGPALHGRPTWSGESSWTAPARSRCRRVASRRRDERESRTSGGGSAPVLWLSLLGAALLAMALLGGRRPRARVEAR